MLQYVSSPVLESLTRASNTLYTRQNDGPLPSMRISGGYGKVAIGLCNLFVYIIF